ncbi:MAG: methyltransferase domain-containing protein [Bacteroidota bacterium]
MIDPKYLKLILAIDQQGSLNKASKELNLTQSALSHQLRNLEEYLGIDIFHRTGNQLFFTDAGKELKDRAELILADLSALERRMQEIKESQLAKYIHGYSKKESQRLMDQANTVADYLHYDSLWENGAKILEVGCGVGAQTEIIAQKNPGTKITSIDISQNSLDIAQSRIKNKGIKNVEFRLQDIKELNPGKDGLFDHLFVCFLLEHLSNPLHILTLLKKLIKPDGTITVIEGDHGSTFFYPDDPFAKKLVNAQVELQQKRGGNANIGRELFPLLTQAGYQNITVSPRQVYVDNSRPKLVEGFIKNTFTAMISGMSENIIAEKIVTQNELEKGIKGLLRTSETDGVFSYTFFKAKATV